MLSNIKRLAFFEKWIDPVAEEMLATCPDIELTRLEYGANPENTISALARSHGYQVSTGGDVKGPWLANADLIARCPDLLAVSSTGAGYDVIDVEACTAAGIMVCNQAGSNREAVAEHTLAFMISLSKRIALTDKELRSAEGTDRYGNVGRDIRGRTLGIVGIGHTGSRLAELCGSAFDMLVLATDPYLTADQVLARGATKVELAELLSRSDFVSIHCPRSKETLGMFNAALISRMKSSAYLISTARGGIVNEDDLVRALSNSQIAGAALDVFVKEPPPSNHPLLAFRNVIATPHIAGMTEEALHEMAASAARQWISLFAGAVPPHVVNPEVWPRYAARFQRLLGFAPQSIQV